MATKLTPIQKDALINMLIAIKYFFLAAPRTDEEKAATRAIVEQADIISEVFNEVQ